MRRPAPPGPDGMAAMTRVKAGRSSYLSADKFSGHNDQGAEAVARLLENLARTGKHLKFCGNFEMSCR